MKNFLKFKNHLSLIIIFYLIFNFNFYQLEFYYDDYWFVNAFKDSNNLILNFKSLKEMYIVRPIGLIYLSLLSLIEAEKLHIYYVINILIWVISSIILHLSFYKLFNKKFALVFLLILIFPSFSSAFLFSPIIQGLGTISIFFWSLSIYFLSIRKSNKNLILSLFFIILSFLSYEISFSLIPINIFIFCYLNKVFLKDYKKITNIILKLFIFSFIAVIIFYFFQNFLSKLSNANLTKYGFFEEDFIFNLKKYFFSPIILIFYEIPKHWIEGFLQVTTDLNLFSISLISVFNVICYLIFFNNNLIDRKSYELKNILIFNFFLSLVFFGIFLIYLIATSVPDIKGYYNRGLLSLHILFAIFFAQFVFFKNRIFIIFLIVILNLNFLSFYQKTKIHLDYGEERRKIIKKTLGLSKENYLIFSYFKTFKKNNYNSIPIFSDEVFDYSNAVSFYAKNKIVANRIYKNKECNKILNFKDGFLKGMVPSRNKKIKEDQLIDFIKIDEDLKNTTTIIIYDYVNQSFRIGKIHDLNNLLSEVFGCN